VDAFFHQSLDVLKMSSHPHFEKLLRVDDVDLVRHFTSNFVNDNRHSAMISVLTLAWSSSSSAVEHFFYN
jgi:succinate dehydrogenase flavin-adding protein (antitoxin of CptAB toxin-antitoxin module)